MNYFKRALNSIILLISLVSFSQEVIYSSQDLVPSILPQTNFEDIIPSTTIDNNQYVYLDLHIKPNEAPYNPYKYKLVLKVTPIYSNGTTGAIEDVELVVENNLINSGNFLNSSRFILENAYNASVEIISTSYQDLSSGTIPEIINGSAPLNLEFEIGFDRERHQELLDFSVITVNQTTINNELKLNWAPVDRATHYDVEWTWVDNYGEEENVPKPANQIYFNDKDFKNNNTRINTKETSYNIPLVYNQGYIIYRVRAVGKWISNLERSKYGPWSSGYNTKEFVSNWNDKYLISSDFEGTKNWQFQSSYAEEGKKKEIISYFDGTLRNRQTVTTLNTDNNTVIGEVIYDAQGRPAIEVLPTPIEGRNLNFNDTYINKNSNDQPYSFIDFDLDAQNNPDNFSLSKQMSINSGASKYYSNNNAIASEFKNQIPDAEQFPFSQIEYTPDNTGRIRRKSGVGKTHQLGTSHEMEYFYTTPESKELNRLFGYSVGHASMYKKNMVLDPNGQLSISYIDPQGRTIATALAGDNPQNLLGLYDENEENGLHGFVDTDLLAKISPNSIDTYIDNNHLGITGNLGALYDKLYYFGVKSVAFDEVRKFNYTLKNTDPYFSFGCIDDNSYPIVYDLEIGILNEDSNTIASLNQTINLGELTNNTYLMDEIEQMIPRGSFSIYKNLKVNKTILEGYADDFIARIQDENNIDCFSYQEAQITSTTEEINGCFVDCDDCENQFKADYPTDDDYKNVKLAAYLGITLNQLLEMSDIEVQNLTGLSNQEFENLKASYIQQWHEVISACRIPCSDGTITEEESTNTAVCASSQSLLLYDMGKTGQYGNNGGQEDPATYALSIYNQNNILLSTKTNTDGVQNSWKNPHHYEYDGIPSSSGLNTSGHYYTDIGAISKIIVTLVDEENNIYDPAIDEDAPIEPTVNASITDQYWVEPQYLTNVSDFLELAYVDSFSESLLIYHPEFDYLEYIIAECQMTIPIANSQNGYHNSDTFNEYLTNINTYEEAVSEGLLTGNLDIYSADPYYINTLGLPFENTYIYDARKEIMLTALNSDFDGFGSAMVINAEAKIRCNSITECDLLPSINAVFSSVSSNPSVEFKNKFWLAYRSSYLSVKQKTQSLFRNVYAFKHGGFNGCLGASSSPIPLSNTISNYPNVANTISSYLNTSPQNICDYQYADFYVEKQKRFFSPELFYNTAASNESVATQLSEQVNYQYYIGSGICPIARDFQIYLSQYFAEVNLSTSQNPTDTHTYSGQYLSPMLFEEFDGVYPALANSISQSGNINGQILTLELIENGVTLPNSLIALEIPPQYDWNNYGNWLITDMNTITSSYDEVNNLFTYSILANIQTTSGNTEQVIVTGTTSARLSECFINPADADNSVGQYLGNSSGWGETGECEIETFTSKALIELFNDLIVSNQINLNSVDIINFDSYANNYLNEFFPAGTTVLWNNNGTGSYSITIDNVTVFQMTLDQNIPSNVTIVDLNFFLLSNNNVFYGQEIDLIWQDNTTYASTTITGNVSENDTRLLNFLCCDDINNYIGNLDSCLTKDCKEVILDIFNYLLENNLFNSSVTNLQNQPGFSDLCFDELYGLDTNDQVSLNLLNGTSAYFALEINGQAFVLISSPIEFNTMQNLLDFEEGQPISFPVQDSDTNAAAFSFIDSLGNVNSNSFKLAYACSIHNNTPQRLANSSVTSNCETQEPCIPQPLSPVSSTEQYPVFIDIIESVTLDNGLSQDAFDELYISEEEFLNYNFAYITESYSYFIQELGINSTMDLHFIDIGTFGATPYNYGYNNINSVINDYVLYLANTSIDEQDSWVAFASNHYNLAVQANGGCLNVPLPLIVTNQPTIPASAISPCEEFAISIHNTYAQEAYATFLEANREDFINAYVNQAIQQAIETFDMRYYDKEYQYTLYYYDQSGNLTQTVPPKGVDRFSEAEMNTPNTEGLTLNQQINNYKVDYINNSTTENHNLLPNHTLRTQYRYNTLNQLVWQYTPDGGVTKFAYDDLGRIIASQNDKQLNLGHFSYTAYDNLGRIIEAGEFKPSVNLTIDQSTGRLQSNEISQDQIHNNYPSNVTHHKFEVTKTRYANSGDVYVDDGETIVDLNATLSIAPTLFQTVDDIDVDFHDKSRNRVQAIYYFDEWQDETTQLSDYENALYYNYDIHGNVVELAQHNKLLDLVNSEPYTGVKNVEYEYDLISGNVNKVYYQKGKKDQFIHKYQYDADNRIISVQTSSDGYVWEVDANYNYYPHGPLARVLLGDLEVQGIDYAYTLQGWLKGVNSNTLNPNNDLGKDGQNNTIAKDAFAYSLSYFNDTSIGQVDYTPIGNINAFVNNSSITNPYNLYNGNIKQMTTAITNFDEQPLGSQINNYQYDQLNRIKNMQGFDSSANQNYNSSYSYDNNGNLDALNRANHLGVDIDKLAYTYKEKINPITNQLEYTNQLDYVNDLEGDAGFGDIDAQAPGNYDYDEIGQLIKDHEEGLDIHWRVDGKVKSIDKEDGTSIHFTYDGLGNRIAKTILPDNKTTVYARDAQGNVMAVYETNESDLVPSNAKEVWLKEHHIYGSSRLGLESKLTSVQIGSGTIQDILYLPSGEVSNTQIKQAFTSIIAGGALPDSYKVVEGGNLTLQAGQEIILKPGFEVTGSGQLHAFIEEVPSPQANTITHVIGDKRYELSNHLGNVLSVITDRKLIENPNNPSFKPDVIAYNDYYPFGMTLPKRHGSTDVYRYGFQGQEKDHEVKGEGNSYNYKYRMHDPRIGRFFAVDPMTAKYPHYSPYSFSGNKLINSRELEGLEEMLAIDKIDNNPSAWFYVDRREMGHFGGLFSASFGRENSFVKASIHNTENLKSSLYRTIAERHSYYNFVHLYMKEKGISNQWFKAAAEVTKYNPFALEVGVGAAAKSATNLWFLSDSTEEFLRGGNEFLFSHNMNNAKRIIENDGKINDSFTDANCIEQSFFGLVGVDLDLKLVEFEQTLVQTYINDFKANNPKADMGHIIGQINNSFSNPLAPNSVSKVIREFFTEVDADGNETINFDFSNYEHRVKLGQEIIRDLYEDEEKD